MEASKVSLEDRVKLGILARENFESLFWDTSTFKPEELAIYCEVIRDEALKRSPLPEVKTAQAKLPTSSYAMTDEECKKFEKEEIPFGKHKGETIEWLFEHERSYLDWVAENVLSEFGEKLQRYLANPSFANA